jgi:DNA-binding PadR family transcriptional regulator
MEEAFSGEWPGENLRWLGGGGGRGKGPRRHHRSRQDEFERLAALREFRGGGPFGGGPRGRGRGRRRRGDVRTAILLLLDEEPRNGYQLMQVIEERSDARWRPSPGSVYPILSQLEDEGLVRATEHDGSKLFELTDAGREQASAAKEAAPPWDPTDEDTAGHTAHTVRRLIPQIAQAAVQVSHVGNEQQLEQAIETLKGARQALYRILAENEDV